MRGQGKATPTEEELEQLYNEATRFTLASHFLWGCWAIVQESKSDIDFGFMEFAICRMDQYFQLKKTILEKKDK